MVAIIGIGMPNRHQRRAQRALAALRHDDPIDFRQMRPDQGDHRKFKPTRARAGLGHTQTIAANPVRNGREWRSFPRACQFVSFILTQPDTHQTIADLGAHETGN